MKTSFPLNPFLRYFAQKWRSVFVEKSIFSKPKKVSKKYLTKGVESGRILKLSREVKLERVMKVSE